MQAFWGPTTVPTPNCYTKKFDKKSQSVTIRWYTRVGTVYVYVCFAHVQNMF